MQFDEHPGFLSHQRTDFIPEENKVPSTVDAGPRSSCNLTCRYMLMKIPAGEIRAGLFFALPREPYFFTGHARPSRKKSVSIWT
jgi:hypothetical protein